MRFFLKRDQAIVIGQALLHGKWLECAFYANPSISPSSYQSIFYDDNTLYKPGSVIKL